MDPTALRIPPRSETYSPWIPPGSGSHSALDPTALRIPPRSETYSPWIPPGSGSHSAAGSLPAAGLLSGSHSAAGSLPAAGLLSGSHSAAGSRSGGISHQAEEFRGGVKRTHGAPADILPAGRAASDRRDEQSDLVAISHLGDHLARLGQSRWPRQLCFSRRIPRVDCYVAAATRRL